MIIVDWFCVAANPKSTMSVFEYDQEVKFKFTGSQDVKFVKRGVATISNALSLRIPLDHAEKLVDTREHDQSESKRPRVDEPVPNDEELQRVPFSACLKATFAPANIMVYHPVTDQKVPCTQTFRFATFPRYLMVKLDRYFATENWTINKIKAEVSLTIFLVVFDYLLV
jgi:uncharacterized UBP type Zn finger protein